MSAEISIASTLIHRRAHLLRPTPIAEFPGWSVGTPSLDLTLLDVMGSWNWRPAGPEVWDPRLYQRFPRSPSGSGLCVYFVDVWVLGLMVTAARGPTERLLAFADAFADVLIADHLAYSCRRRVGKCFVWSQNMLYSLGLVGWRRRYFLGIDILYPKKKSPHLLFRNVAPETTLDFYSSYAQESLFRLREEPVNKEY